jgi:hypothetical protein
VTRLKKDEIAVKPEDHYYQRSSFYGSTTWMSRARTLEDDKVRLTGILEGLLELFPELDKVRTERATSFRTYRDWDSTRIQHLAEIQRAAIKSKQDAADLAAFKAVK